LGCEGLVEFLANDFSTGFGAESVVSNARHFQCLQASIGHIHKATLEFESGIGLEFVSLNLKAGLLDIQNALGVCFDDQILDRVFKEFCIGK
jgi:tRNA modification GTPase